MWKRSFGSVLNGGAAEPAAYLSAEESIMPLLSHVLSSRPELEECSRVLSSDVSAATIGTRRFQPRISIPTKIGKQATVE